MNKNTVWEVRIEWCEQGVCMMNAESSQWCEQSDGAKVREHGVRTRRSEADVSKACDQGVTPCESIWMAQLLLIHGHKDQMSSDKATLEWPTSDPLTITANGESDGGLSDSCDWWLTKRRFPSCAKA